MRVFRFIIDSRSALWLGVLLVVFGALMFFVGMIVGVRVMLPASPTAASGGQTVATPPDGRDVARGTDADRPRASGSPPEANPTPPTTSDLASADSFAGYTTLEAPVLGRAAESLLRGEPLVGEQVASEPTPVRGRIELRLNAAAAQIRGVYALQLGAFADLEHAFDVQEYALAVGMHPWIVITGDGADALYRVRVGSYPTWESAVEASRRLEAVSGLESTAMRSEPQELVWVAAAGR